MAEFEAAPMAAHDAVTGRTAAVLLTHLQDRLRRHPGRARMAQDDQTSHAIGPVGGRVVGGEIVILRIVGE